MKGRHSAEDRPYVNGVLHEFDAVDNVAKLILFGSLTVTLSGLSNWIPLIEPGDTNGW